MVKTGDGGVLPPPSSQSTANVQQASSSTTTPMAAAMPTSIPATVRQLQSGVPPPPPIALRRVEHHAIQHVQHPIVSHVRGRLPPHVQRVLRDMAPQHLLTANSLAKMAEDDQFRRSSTAALPLRVQKLKKHLDLTRFMTQLERLLEQPIKIPAGASLIPPVPNSRGGHASIFSVKSVWPNEADRTEHASRMYNFKNLKGRGWLKDLLVAESDSDSEGESSFSEKDLHALLKIHRKRRQLQKMCSQDPTNSQYMHYGAGLLSVQDPFPEHQASVLRQVSRN